MATAEKFLFVGAGIWHTTCTFGVHKPFEQCNLAAQDHDHRLYAARFTLLEMGKGQTKLEILRLTNNQLAANAILAVTLVIWPRVCCLELRFNKLVVGVMGIDLLVSCSWPLLEHLNLGHAVVDGPALRQMNSLH